MLICKACKAWPWQHFWNHLYPVSGCWENSCAKQLIVPTNQDNIPYLTVFEIISIKTISSGCISNYCCTTHSHHDRQCHLDKSGTICYSLRGFQEVSGKMRGSCISLYIYLYIYINLHAIIPVKQHKRQKNISNHRFHSHRYYFPMHSTDSSANQY